ncbi:MAG: hypothetical protein JXO44_10225, partial [Clostridia bacterium]|nr:hypothetical protein [Clostridia bacterium]
MKRKLLILSLLTLTLIFSGCGGSDVESSTPANSDSNSTQSAPVSEPAETAPQTTEVALTDQALLDSINGEMPDEYIMTQKTQYLSDMEGSEMNLSSTIKMTVMGDYSMMEMDNEMMPGTFVTIYNPDEKTTYQYTKGQTFGMKFEDVEGSMNDMFQTDENEMDVVEFEDIDDTFGDHFIARKEVYNGKDVIYIESTDGAMSDNTKIKMWYSDEFYIPLKYEIYSDDKLIMSSEVIEFEAHPSLSKADFEPPSDID